MGIDRSCFEAIANASFDLTTLTSDWQPLNGTGFSDDIKILEIFNGGAVGVDISFDGVTKHTFWPSGATLVIDFQTNHSNANGNNQGTLNGRKGQIIWGRTSTTSTYLQMSGYR